MSEHDSLDLLLNQTVELIGKAEPGVNGRMGRVQRREQSERGT